MDSYVAQQIVIWMVAASFAGFVIGWVARSRKKPKASRNAMRRLR